MRSFITEEYLRQDEDGAELVMVLDLVDESQDSESEWTESYGDY